VLHGVKQFGEVPGSVRCGYLRHEIRLSDKRDARGLGWNAATETLAPSKDESVDPLGTRSSAASPREFDRRTGVRYGNPAIAKGCTRLPPSRGIDRPPARSGHLKLGLGLTYAAPRAVETEDAGGVTRPRGARFKSPPMWNVRSASRSHARCGAFVQMLART
jgi:hypothetical protein